MGAVLWGEDYRTVKDPRSADLRRADKALTEKAWQAEVIGEARRLGYTFLYHHRPALVGKPPRWITNTIAEGTGFPDVTALRGGFGLVLELKQETKSPDPRQEEWLRAWAELPNVIAVWARPRDRALVYDLLRRPWAYLPASPTAGGTGSTTEAPCQT